MKKDPTEFNKRFKRWLNGEKVYDAGRALPGYEDGKDAEKIYDGGLLPQVTVTAKMPSQWMNNVEMQKQYGESENDYIERMTSLSQRRHEAIRNVNRALHEAAKNIFEVAKQPAYFVPGIGNAVLGADVTGQVLNKDYVGAAATLGTVGALKYGTPYLIKGAKKLVGNTVNTTNNVPLKQYGKPMMKTRLRLPSHTKQNPREFVLDHEGDNKFRVHMRTWDGDHVPANMSASEKQALYNALYEELPEGAEILFPKSGEGYYATRGTVAGLQRLARDSRFTPGTRGTLLYLDKDGKTVRTYEGTSFIKAPRITSENAANITPEQWTAVQDAAIARGNVAEAQRLRDLHFKVSAPTPYISKGVYLPSGSKPTLSQADYYNGNNDLVTLYHSSVDADNLIKEGFDGVEHGLGRTKGEPKGTIFASANPDYAADYSNLYIYEGLSTPDKVGLMELKVPRGAGAFEGNEVRLRPEHIKEITKSAYEKTPWLKWRKTRKTDNNLFNIKSADAVTFDDNGVKIPLGERDNFNINDIRYAIFPFVGGVVGYGLYDALSRESKYSELKARLDPQFKYKKK